MWGRSRHKPNYVSWKQRKAESEDLKAIYHAPIIEQAEIAMDEFAVKWDDTHPTISRSWRRNRERLRELRNKIRNEAVENAAAGDLGRFLCPLFRSQINQDRHRVSGPA